MRSPVRRAAQPSTRWRQKWLGGWPRYTPPLCRDAPPASVHLPTHAGHPPLHSPPVTSRAHAIRLPPHSSSPVTALAQSPGDRGRANAPSHGTLPPRYGGPLLGLIKPQAVGRCSPRVRRPPPQLPPHPSPCRHERFPPRAARAAEARAGPLWREPLPLPDAPSRPLRAPPDAWRGRANERAPRGGWRVRRAARAAAPL